MFNQSLKKNRISKIYLINKKMKMNNKRMIMSKNNKRMLMINNNNKIMIMSNNKK